MKPRYLILTLAMGLSLTIALLWLLGSSPISVVGAPAPVLQPPPRDVVTETAFLPLIVHDPGTGLWVDIQNRQASLDYFNQVYRASEGVAAGWTGSHANCNAGSTSAAFREAVRLRINYFRAMAGVPGTVTLSDEYTQKAQEAALMMSVNHDLDHSPPTNWICYSPEGAEAAGRSNLCLGCYGYVAIDAYMRDYDIPSLGHRRWILYPQTQEMGTGDIPPVPGYWSSNALWVITSDYGGPRPETREEFVAWPPPGYVPNQVVYSLWSFSYPGANFNSATVSMSSGGQTIQVDVKPIASGYGENTLVWEPDASFGSPPASDKSYRVSVTNVLVNQTWRNFTYRVTVFDPGSRADRPTEVERGQVLGQPPRLP